MRQSFCLISFTALVTCLTLSLAHSALASGNAIAEAANDPVWIRLVHYDRNGERLQSTVHSAEFFLADDGAENPLTELQATLAAFALPVGSSPDQHARCRFPARFIWAKSRALTGTLPDISCPAYDSWIFGRSTESVSIVFATGYLGNPASYYGHSLIKFNSPNDQQTSSLLDVTVNYGAIIPPDVGPITYIAKGALGGFEAGFSHIQYYFHDHNYGDVELRDLWEYELNLRPEEVDMIVAHAWELLGRKFTYYFFRKNCAYRMAELLQIVDGIEIIPPRRPWTVPQALIRRTAGSELHDQPLVGEVTYHPSRQSRFYRRFRQLDDRQQSSAKTYVKTMLATGSAQSALEALRPLSEPAQQQVIDALLDYYQFQIPKGAASDDPGKRAYQALIQYRFGLRRAPALTTDTPQRHPAEDVPPGYVSVAIADNDALGTGALLRIRAAYYDALDASVSHVADSELSMGDITLAAFNGDVRLRHAQLFRVESVNAALSGLPGDNGKAWRLALGVTAQDQQCEDCLVARFEGDIGRSRSLGSKVKVGAYLGGAIQDNRNRNGNAFFRASGFINMNVSHDLRWRLRYEHRDHFNSNLGNEDLFELEGRLALPGNWDTRLRVTRLVTTEIGWSLGYYW